MDILKARKKAKKKAKERDAEKAAPDAKETPPLARDAAASDARDLDEVLSELEAAPPAAKAPEKVPAKPAEPTAEEAAALGSVLGGEEAARSGALAQDLDDAIAEIEGEQEARRRKGGQKAEMLQQSVADFVASFEGSEEEEDSYRHSFVRMEEDEGVRERFLCFRLADETYAVALRRVRETIQVPHITEVPRNPDYVSGIISLRGLIVPVIDLRVRLSLPLAPLTKKARIVVTEREGVVVGLIVDQVYDVVEVRTDKIEPPPAVLGGAEAEFIRGVGRSIPAKGEEPRVLILLRLATVNKVDREVAA